MSGNGSNFQVKVTPKQRAAMVKAMRFPDPPAQKVTTPVFGAAPQGTPSSNPLARIAAANANQHGPLVRIARAEGEAYGKGGKRKTRKSKKSRKSTKRRSKH